MQEGASLKKKIVCSGWQSWSLARGRVFIRFPRYLFPPREYDSRLEISKPVRMKDSVWGWCSWPAFGTDVCEKKILGNVDWLKEKKDFGIDYILIDDGWTSWGDWLECDETKFPSGMLKISRAIRERGFRPGIWISPFLVDPKSRLALEKPDWLLRDEDNRLVDGLRLVDFKLLTYLFPKQYLLDVRKREVRDYLKEVFKVLFEKYCFELVKLDFLYSVYFNPYWHEEEAERYLSEFLDKIKRNYPRVYTIACGCPLADALGRVDSFRIGPDNSIDPLLGGTPVWLRKILNFIYSKYFWKVIKNNFARRRWTENYWNLDLDSFVCDRKHGFSNRQTRYFCKLLKEAGGNMFLGDDLTELDESDVCDFILPLFRKGDTESICGNT